MKQQNDFIETALLTDDTREIVAIVSKLPKQSRIMFAGIAVGYAAALGVDVDLQPAPKATAPMLSGVHDG